MATLPNTTVTVQDPGLGVVTPATSTPVFIGTASSGTENAYTLLSTKKALVDTFGDGPAVQAALHTMSVAGGPVGFIRATSSTAASNGTVTVTGTAPTPTLSGASDNDYSVRIEILSTGDLGAGTFRYSLDAVTGGDTSTFAFSGTQTIPAGGAYALGDTGVTVTFLAGSHVAGAVITFDVACAASTSGDIGTALTQLGTVQTNWDFVYVVTSKNTGDNAAHATIAAAVEAKLVSFENDGKWKAGIMSTNRDDSDPVTEWADDALPHMCIVHGSCRTSTDSGKVGYAFPTVPAANPVCARATSALISTDLKRVADGALVGVLAGSLTKDAATSGGEAWDDIQLSSLRTYNDLAGSFITQARIKSQEGSDFTIWPRRRVMNEACKEVHRIQQGWIGRGVRTNDNGTIDERDALALETEMNVAIEAKLLTPRNQEGTDGHISAFRYTIDRNHNVLSTSTIQAELAIRPLAYLDYITATVGFTVSVGTGEDTEGEA